jgi:hypothetical protein
MAFFNAWFCLQSSAVITTEDEFHTFESETCVSISVYQVIFFIYSGFYFKFTETTEVCNLQFVFLLIEFVLLCFLQTNFYLCALTGDLAENVMNYVQ